MTDDEPKESPSGPKWGKWFLWGFVFFFIVYPLSIGPAVWIGDKTEWPFAYTKAFEGIHFPMNRTYAKLPVVRDFLNWYVNGLWRQGRPVGT